MPVSTQLRESQAAKFAEARTFLARAKAEDRVMNEDENRQFEALFDESMILKAEIDKILSEDEKRAKLDAAEAELAALEEPATRGIREPVAGTPPVDGPLVPGAWAQRYPELRGVDPMLDGIEFRDGYATPCVLGGAYVEGVSHRTASPEYRSAFARHMRGGPMDPILESRDLTMGTDSEGGYTVAPEQLVARLIQAVDDMMWVRQFGTGMTVRGAKQLGAPALDADPADSDWTAEITAVTEDSTMAFGKRVLVPYALRKLLKVSKTLIRNSVLDIEAIVAQRLAYKTAAPREQGYMTGSGTNQPLGLFTASASGIPTSRDVEFTSATVVDAPHLKEIQWTLKAGYNGVWLMSRTFGLQVAQLVDGGGQYVWRQGIEAGNPDRLLGDAIYISEFAPATSTTGLYACLYGDLSYYWYVDELDVMIQRLVELYATTNQDGFIVDWAGDGMPVLEDAFVRGILA